MKLDLPRKEFHEAVGAAGQAASGRTTINILQNLLVEAKDGTVRVLGCDGELWVERTFAAMVNDPGAVCLPAKTLGDIVGQLAGDVSLEAKENGQALLTQGGSEYKLMTLDASDFPAPSNPREENSLRLKMGILRDAVDSVTFAVSTDQHRQVLTGVLFQYNGKTLTLVATDTHRLAVRRIEQEGLGSDVSAIVPDKALRAIRSLPMGDEDEVTIVFGDGKLSVEAPGARVVSQLLAGTYPNWERVVPAEHTRSWTVETDQLAEKIKRAMILARDSANRVRLRGDGDRIIISARSEEKGDAKEEVGMVADNGAIEIAFNGKYVQDVLAAVHDQGVKIEMTEPSRPAVVRPAEDTDNAYFCVIMPMALA